LDFGETEEYIRDIFCDPQTSGGLLISVSPEDAKNIMKDLEEAEMETVYGIIGRVVEQEEKSVKLR
jgi:selenide,water dikinase